MNNIPSPLKNGDQLINHSSDWESHRGFIQQILFDYEYGPIPEKPQSQNNDLLHLCKRFEKYSFETYTISFPNGPQLHIQLEITYPEGDGPFPIVINGDGCWKYLSDEIVQECMDNKCILAHFNRTTVARDVPGDKKDSAIYSFYADRDFGAISAWAWAYHRCIDFLSALPIVDSEKIILSGHSRGGKAVLLAGATDERVAITNPNNSGCGGSGSFRFQGPDSEHLKDILGAFPHWFCTKLLTFVHKQHELPFDQNFLKALVAPRALLSTEALGDLWANPEGTAKSHQATKEVYALYNKEDNLNIFFRQGDHQHGIADWKVLFAFCQQQFNNTTVQVAFNNSPFT